jgi:O-antigen ligase
MAEFFKRIGSKTTDFVKKLNKENSNITPLLFVVLTVMYIVAYNSSLRAISLLWYAVSLIAIVFIAIRYFKTPKKQLGFYTVWAILFFIYSALSFFWAIEKELVFEKLKSLGLVFLVHVLLIQIITKKEDVEKLLKANFIALVVLLFYVIIKSDKTSIGSLRIGVDTLGEYWNANDIGLKCSVGLLFALYFLFKGKNSKTTNAFYIISAVLFGIVIFLTGSRKAFIMLAIIMCMFFWLRAKENKLLILLMLLLTISVLVLLTQRIPSLYNVIGVRIDSLFKNLFGIKTSEGSFGIRQDMISLGLNWFKERPIFGYGLDNYSALYFLEHGVKTYSHCNFIEILVNGGLFGFLLYYSIYVYIFIKLCKKACKKRDLLAIVFFIYNISSILMQIAFVNYYSTLDNFILMATLAFIRIACEKNKFESKVSKFVNNPLLLIKNFKLRILQGKRGKSIDDEKFLKKVFKLRMNKNLDLENPKTFNEKLQWLKLYYRDEKLTKLVDKYEVRKYIKDTLGEKYLIPLLGVWNTPEEIDFASLPDKFVLKCNHNSGLGMCICTDKSKLDIEKVKKELAKGLKQDYYLTGREWPYKNVKPRIIAEEYISDISGGLIDYKFFCFNGVADCVMVCIDRHLGDTKFYFFDKKWSLKRINKRGKEAPKGFTLNKPKKMDEMFAIAERLSKGFPYVRVDLYECNDKIYFGEMTFFPDSGFDANILPETDKYFGDLIKLKS